METKKIVLIISIIIVLIIGGFYLYLRALGSMWVLHPPDKTPYYITTKPIIVNNILLPKETKITYNKRYFWETYEQKKPLNEKNITGISLKEGITIDWAGVPVKEIIKFYNTEMKGYSVYPDFNKLDERQKTHFSNLWESCQSDLGITVQNTDDWSFNKKNILAIESCGVNYQRYFKEDKEQQRFLDKLYNELTKIND